MEYKFDPEASVIVLNVDLRGTSNFVETVKMVVDTGSTYTLIPWRIVNVLGLEPEVSKERLDLTTASGVEKAPLVVLESIKVADKEVKNAEAVVHDLPPKSYVDGLLGLSFLRHFSLLIDFRQGILRLE